MPGSIMAALVTLLSVSVIASPCYCHTDTSPDDAASASAHAFTLPHVSLLPPHNIHIDGATVTATVLGEMSVTSMTVPETRVHVVKPCECQNFGVAFDMQRVMTYAASGGNPIGIVHYVDVAWKIVAPEADSWSATIRFVDLDNGGSEDVETGTGKTASGGTVHIGLGPGRYALFLIDVYAQSSVGYHEDHPIDDHEDYLEHGAFGIVTVGDVPCGGLVTMLTGDARVERSSDRDVGNLGAVSSLHFGTVIHAGDVITTGGSAFMEISLPDKSTIRMGPNSSVRFDEVLCEPISHGFSARLFFGNIWFRVSTALGGDGKFEVKTDNDGNGVRGTIFTVETDTARTIYRVFPEPGKMSEMVVHNNSGDTVIVHATEETVVERGRIVVSPRPFNPADVDRWWEAFDTMRALMSIEWSVGARADD